MSDTRFLRCYWELLLEGGNKETLRKILRDLFPEQPDETKLSQLIQKITLFISILNLPYLCTAEVTLLSGLLPVRRRAETVEPAISLLKLVHRCCSTEQVILKFLPLVTTAQLQTYSLTTLAAKVTVPSVLSQLASSVTPVSVGLLVSREEDEGNNEWRFLSKSCWAEKVRNILHSIWMQSNEPPLESEKCLSRNQPCRPLLAVLYLSGVNSAL